MHTNRADMERAVRWMDRATMWKARGFREPSKYCTEQVRTICRGVILGIGQKGTGNRNPLKERALSLIDWSKRVDQIEPSREAFETSMNEFWNGHWSEKCALPPVGLTDGQPNLKEMAPNRGQNGLETRKATPNDEIAPEHIKAGNTPQIEPETSQEPNA